MGIENKEYCGTIVLEVDGVEYETVSVDATTKTGNKAVATMNSKRRSLGTMKGTKEHELKLEVLIPCDGDEPDWDNFEGGTLTLYPACGSGGKRDIYIGCTTEEVGSKYQVGKESVRSITMHALDKQSS
jgi:hypothetical protein